MILIIDGHGDEAATNFDFKRSAATKATLYSYTAAGISHQGVSSISVIKTAVEGNIPAGYYEATKSRIGGGVRKDRVLAALASTDQPFNQFPAGFVSYSNANYRVYVSASGNITYFGLALDSTSSALLSQVLGFYADRELDVIWAPCRGGGGAASARYAKMLAMEPAKYQEIFTKTYGTP